MSQMQLLPIYPGAPHYLSSPNKHPRGSSPVTISDSTPVARGGGGEEKGTSSCNPIVIDLTESSDEEDVRGESGAEVEREERCVC